ncbi:MAG TPA: hypothetical protein VGD80_17250 [Kofleriaceae bacterium]
MIERIAQSTVMCAALFAAACSMAREDSAARVTIDVRCASNADCPRGFTCKSELEHGPPTTMCESDDPGASCPREYETHVGYGQVFCIPRLGVRAHSGWALSRAARLPHEAASAAEPPRSR